MREDVLIEVSPRSIDFGLKTFSGTPKVGTLKLKRVSDVPVGSGQTKVTFRKGDYSICLK